MIFDRALSIEHARGILDELRPLLTAKRFHARGLTQDGDRVTQWHVEVDQPARSWFLSSENGTTYEVRDGMATLGNDSPSGSRAPQGRASLRGTASVREDDAP